MPSRKYWLFKSEPNAFSFAHLQSEADRTAEWDGVRNYQARNFMRDEMKVGDGVLFYHSSTAVPAVVGTAKVVREAYPDHTSWEQGSKYYDPKSTPENPLWFMVDIQAEEKFSSEVSLEEIKGIPNLQSMMLVRRGMRLSIQPVGEEEWEQIVELGRRG